jgi:two-component system, response regulator PdtaR
MFINNSYGYMLLNMKPSKSSSRIVVVEDEGIIAEDIRMALIDMGYEVMGIFASGEKAISFLHDNTPDLVLMDIFLKGERDGIETAAIIKENKDLPIVFLSANSDSLVLDRAKRVEPSGYLLKPFNDRELATTIEISIYRHKHEQERKEMMDRLKYAEGKLETLNNLLPMCSKCKSVRNDFGYWQAVDAYIQEHSDKTCSHSLCPSCMEDLYPEYADKVKEKLAQ